MPLLTEGKAPASRFQCETPASLTTEAVKPALVVPVPDVNIDFGTITQACFSSWLFPHPFINKYTLKNGIYYG